MFFTRLPLITQPRTNPHSGQRLSRLCSALVFSLALIFSAGSAWAVTLSEAKEQGYLGEQPNGYLGMPAGDASAEVESLMTTINKKRQAAYEESARDAGVSLEIMEKRVGQRLINKAPRGQYVQTQDGRWIKK